VVDGSDTDKSTASTGTSGPTIAVAVVLGVLVAILVVIVLVQRRNINEARLQKDQSSFGIGGMSFCIHILVDI
jgi:hypothetical protein